MSEPLLETRLNGTVDWFEAGSAIFDGIVDDPAWYPPPDDTTAQREWLAGFGAAWCALADLPAPATGEDPRRDTLDTVLTHRLQHRPELLRRLTEHRKGAILLCATT